MSDDSPPFDQLAAQYDELPTSTPAKPRRSFVARDPYKALPSSMEAEQGTLCSFLLNPREVGALCAERRISEHHFHVPAHATIHALIAEMWSMGKPIDIVTLTQALHDRNLLETCGGGSMVSNLFTFIPSALNVDYYLTTLEEKRTLREIVRQCTALAERAYVEQDNVPGLVSELADLSALVGSPVHRAAPTIRELADDKERRITSTERPITISTGLTKLDKESPIVPGSMPLISGEKKAGKSILAVSIAAHMIAAGKRVLYFTLEDPASSVVDRLTANLSGVPIVRHSFEAGLGVQECDNLARSLHKLRTSAFSIRDDVYDLAAIVAVIRQEQARFPDLCAVFIDYGQLVRAKVRKQDTREMEVASISRTIRLLSIELKLAIIVLVHLNKDGATRESAALENDCTAMWRVKKTEDPKERLLEIPYQRNGDSQIAFKVAFQGHLCRYENYAGNEEEATSPPDPNYHPGRSKQTRNGEWKP